MIMLLCPDWPAAWHPQTVGLLWVAAQSSTNNRLQPRRSSVQRQILSLQRLNLFPPFLSRLQCPQAYSLNTLALIIPMFDAPALKPPNVRPRALAATSAAFVRCEIASRSCCATTAMTPTVMHLKPTKNWV